MCVDVMGCGGQTKQRGPGGPKKADTGLVDLTTDKQVSGEGGMGRDKGERRGVYHGGNSRRAGASEGPHLVRLTLAYTQRQNIHLSMAFALIQVCCLPVICPLTCRRWSTTCGGLAVRTGTARGCRSPSWPSTPRSASRTSRRGRCDKQTT